MKVLRRTPKVSIEISDVMLFSIEFHISLAKDLDRKEAQGLFDLVEDYLEEKYQRMTSFRPAGVKMIIRTEAFEKANVLNYMPTPEQSIEILTLVEKYLRPIRNRTEIVLLSEDEQFINAGDDDPDSE